MSNGEDLNAILGPLFTVDVSPYDVEVEGISVPLESMYTLEIGIRGGTGSQGATGITGATGATGLQGPIGPQGPAGTNGTNGVDGVDTFGGFSGVCFHVRDNYSLFDTDTNTDYIQTLDLGLQPDTITDFNFMISVFVNHFYNDPLDHAIGAGTGPIVNWDPGVSYSNLTGVVKYQIIYVDDTTYTSPYYAKLSSSTVLTDLNFGLGENTGLTPYLISEIKIIVAGSFLTGSGTPVPGTITISQPVDPADIISGYFYSATLTNESYFCSGNLLPNFYRTKLNAMETEGWVDTKNLQSIYGRKVFFGGINVNSYIEVDAIPFTMTILSEPPTGKGYGGDSLHFSMSTWVDPGVVTPSFIAEWRQLSGTVAYLDDIDTAIAANPGPTGPTGATGSAGTNGATWSSGITVPSGGVDGDFYLRTTTYDVYKKISGTWTIIVNIQGATGATGTTGTTGATGSAGATGATGANGTDGSTWSQGSVAPSGGVNGDFYLRTSNYDIYQKITGTWTVIGNFQGPTGSTGAAGTNGTNGVNGATWTSGSGVPSGGNNGDYYLRTSNSDVYLKTAGVWSVLLNIQGATGATGATGSTGATGAAGTNGTNGTTWTSGSAVPSGGSDGDYYLRTTNYDVYLKTSGTWSVLLNIKGATGATGSTGSTGSTGTAGANATMVVTSTDTVSLANSGNVTLTFGSQPNLGIVVGSRARFYNSASTFMEGIVFAQTSTSITITADYKVGVGSYSAWTILIAGELGASNVFSTIAVSGQSNVVADNSTDTLTLVAGTNITITTNASTDTITINSSGGSGGISMGVIQARIQGLGVW